MTPLPAQQSLRPPRTKSVLLPASLCAPGQGGRGGADRPQGPSSGHSVLVQRKDLKLRDKDTAVKDDVAEALVPQ